MFLNISEYHSEIKDVGLMQIVINVVKQCEFLMTLLIAWTHSVVTHTHLESACCPCILKFQIVMDISSRSPTFPILLDYRIESHGVPDSFCICKYKRFITCIYLVQKSGLALSSPGKSMPILTSHLYLHEMVIWDSFLIIAIIGILLRLLSSLVL